MGHGTYGLITSLALLGDDHTAKLRKLTVQVNHITWFTNLIFLMEKIYNLHDYLVTKCQCLKKSCGGGKTFCFLFNPDAIKCGV